MSRKTKKVAKRKKEAEARKRKRIEQYQLESEATGEVLIKTVNGKTVVVMPSPRPLFEKYEPLRAELLEFVTPFSGSTASSAYGMFQHPLFISRIYSLDHCAYIHQMLDDRQEILRGYEEQGDFQQAVMTHEKPFRMQVLTEYEHRMSDAVFWKTFADAWTDSENLWQDAEMIDRMLSSPRPHREETMTLEERRALETMPDTLTIYRGFSGKGTLRGWSWTTDREKGEWFARRPTGPQQPAPTDPTLVEATVRKSDVIAYFAGRNESEIVVDPRKVKIVSTTVLKPKKKSAPVKLTDWLKPQMEKTTYGQKA
jgi:hypothetical protein